MFKKMDGLFEDDMGFGDEKAENKVEKAENKVEKAENKVEKAENKVKVGEFTPPTPPAPSGSTDSPKKAKRGRRRIDPRQRVINKIRKAGDLTDDGYPDISQLFRPHTGDSMKISDIAVFIKPPEDEVLAELYKGMSLHNRVNLSACVSLDRVADVGGKILSQGMLYNPIMVADIDGKIECTSGRHRLAFLALIYGTDVEVPVYSMELSLNEARDCVVVANMARRATAMEKAEHAVLQSVKGDSDASQDEIYKRTVKGKKDLIKYFTYLVFDRKVPAVFDFKIGIRSTGGLATLGNIQSYWDKSTSWYNGMGREDCDNQLKQSVEFLNSLVKELSGLDGFAASQQLANNPLSAVGKYYRSLRVAGVQPENIAVDRLAKVLIGLGDIARRRHEETLGAIESAMIK